MKYISLAEDSQGVEVVRRLPNHGGRGVRVGDISIELKTLMSPNL